MKIVKPNLLFRKFCCLVWASLFLTSCAEKERQAVHLEEIAGNEEVLAFMKTFDGRGALSDSSKPSSPNSSLAAFRLPPDLDIKLVLAEPQITQPVQIHFDHKARLWVVQYNQYPYPKDLKVISMDQHIRATFDRVPLPPGRGAKGADKITFFEDTNHDGVFDKSTDAITGLNIATSVALGRGNIWVLNPPYLLAYPDDEDDGIPDGPPVVHLEGFGIEDTHAVANNLRWGPDGWLYGAQGSTCTASVNSAVSKNVRFDGQAIWRYNPESAVFEIFAEGGGNTFDVEIDAKGRIYSGDNGTARGQYYKQGAYYVRNFGKHGALTNPYAFGFLSNMALTGEKVRFTHAFVKYEEAALPDRYQGHMIAINPLQSYVQLSRFDENGSTFRVVDEVRIVETKDHWFRPVDIITGPDGAVYIADWYDSRLSHVDPRDTWSKMNGRIYRLGKKNTDLPVPPVDIRGYSGDELIGLLSHEDRWYRQQALLEFGNRRDTSLVPALAHLLSSPNAQLSLEALWALNLSGGFNDGVALTGLHHADPFVRLWTVRLLGEGDDLSPNVGLALEGIARVEPHPEVRSQLAATAKRLPIPVAIDIIRSLLENHDDSSDPDLPLQIWWALESQISRDQSAVLNMFQKRSLWNKNIVRNVLLERLMQRCVIQADSAGYAACARLLALAPSIQEVTVLLNGLQEGLRGQDIVTLPPVLAEAIKPYETQLTGHSLALGLRQGNALAIDNALSVIADPAAPIGDRLSYVRTFGEIYSPRSVPTLLDIVEASQSSAALRQAALQALQRYDDPAIGKRVVKAYPDKLRADPGVRMAALSLFCSRPVWATELLNAIGRKKQPGEDFIAHTISRDDVPEQVVRQLRMMDDPTVIGMATRLWPHIRFASGSEKSQRMSRVSRILQSGRGDPAPGRQVYLNSCGPCHRLFSEGGMIGPELTGYDRGNINDMVMNIIDPDAYIREGYVTYRLTTTDGRILTGTIAGRSGSTMTLNLLSGDRVTIPETEIKEMLPQSSIMPDNLLDPLTDDQVRDLFAYLTKTD